jgi:YjgF/chorismate_mutase-like, putative endoribonuclease
MTDGVARRRDAMGRVDQRLKELGLELPPAVEPPPGFTFPFAWVRLTRGRAFVSGHGAQAPDGGLVGPFGKVPSEVALDAAQRSARAAAVSMLGSLHRALGDLDRITAWQMVFGMVNADPGYPETTNVVNGFSELVLDVFGPAVGEHARMAVGMATLPLNHCVIVGAELEIDG